MIAVEITWKYSNSVEFARVLSFHNFGNLGSQLKTRYDDTAINEKATYTINVLVLLKHNNMYTNVYSVDKIIFQACIWFDI